ncbi:MULTISPECIES: molybdenum cofactor guanylyltransferase MobA [Vibrio]|jgi:molybdopterin-guanine dinucleotide biosynthesis protein A|uniref:Molybdenum cofactor guanylyltransferase n=1 Tax=Vibrio chagasii TaxID=170679 RepID=A0A2S7VEE5_9VIBR|nr:MULTISPECIES: molybdenum cofactor guanylyltransferase MobA [Vibrio]EDK29805.1 molybdopterin-guanine dinucleotide biosynthesis protein A [Vibrionales bacterium SWAT-3]EGU38423.1 molybdopterin-guanine dinucleotide biosynthesis protein MobA [Vibrio splendidus ATCC 33789]KZX67669.1 molybdenum cofactor guanylyltransferase MobA [Vibrio sp. HI00D65]MCG9693964.1 molybdenum cofactor guanylyltransferase MobA [Vibrio sp. Isolate22]NOI39505.1 molybdenum cofactor guanylyltransferase MobA [Vibrio sp. 070|tara:strand:+ start:1950 stop:2534 length:585 start_codon:yes stop_codon:yes gene_type:complete
MLLPTQTSWVILAGGQASRMGGKDKGLVELNGSPLIQYVIDKLSQQDVSITINANRNLDSYQAFAPVVSDSFPDYPGPLGGIHAGLKNATTDWVGFVPCDSPQISDDLVQRFCAAVKEDSDILVAHDGEFKQPVFTLFHKRVLPKLEAFLERGDRKIILLYKECVTEYVDFSDAPNCFVNLNTPEELTQFGTLQ